MADDPDRHGAGQEQCVDDVNDLVDWVHFEKSRAELGPGFMRKI